MGLSTQDIVSIATEHYGTMGTHQEIAFGKKVAEAAEKATLSGTPDYFVNNDTGEVIPNMGELALGDEWMPLFGQKQPESVPEGYALVLVEPTQAMLDAGYDTQGLSSRVFLEEAWGAMLTASSPAPTKQST